MKSGNAASQTRREEGTEGFVAADALVALAVLSITLVFALRAVSVGAQAARATGETQAARTVMVSLLSDPPRQPGVYNGRSAGLRWTLTVTRLEPDAPLPLCELAASAIGGQGGREYRLSTIEPCAPTPGAGP